MQRYRRMEIDRESARPSRGALLACMEFNATLCVGLALFTHRATQKRSRSTPTPPIQERAMAHATLGNQQKILKSNNTIIANQKRILRNQERLLLILVNEVKILRNQEAIVKNQKKILTGQARILRS
jgi:hypothetical protein